MSHINLNDKMTQETGKAIIVWVISAPCSSKLNALLCCLSLMRSVP